MADKIKVKVKCHACAYEMVGSAKYGKGHYSPEGLDFEFLAIGKLKTKSGSSRVRGQVTITCPNCEVRNRYDI